MIVAMDCFREMMILDDVYPPLLFLWRIFGSLFFIAT